VEDHRGRRGRRPHALDPAILNREIVRLALDHGQICGRQDRPLHGGGVKLAIGLGTRAAHRRTLAPVEDAKLDAALIGDPAHQAIERIDLANEMPLSQPADRGIAGHRSDRRKAVRHRQGSHLRANRGRGPQRGAAAANHDDVEARSIERSCISNWRRFYFGTTRAPGQIRTAVFHAKSIYGIHLLAEGKIAENYVQHVLDVDPPEQAAERARGEPQFLGHDVLPDGDAFVHGAVQRAQGILERVAVPCPRDQGRLARAEEILRLIPQGFQELIESRFS
jgi:hypothetical protein